MFSKVMPLTVAIASLASMWSCTPKPRAKLHPALYAGSIDVQIRNGSFKDLCYVEIVGSDDARRARYKYDSGNWIAENDPIPGPLTARAKRVDNFRTVRVKPGTYNLIFMSCPGNEQLSGSEREVAITEATEIYIADDKTKLYPRKPNPGWRLVHTGFNPYVAPAYAPGPAYGNNNTGGYTNTTPAPQETADQCVPQGGECSSMRCCEDSTTHGCYREHNADGQWTGAMRCMSKDEARR